MTEAEAREFRAAHDADASRLSRTSTHELRQIAAGLRAGLGWERVYGESSKDELISEILGYRYPLATLNETTHVLYHKPGETWSACERCHPHQGSTYPTEAQIRNAITDFETCECPLRGAAVSPEVIR